MRIRYESWLSLCNVINSKLQPLFVTVEYKKYIRVKRKDPAPIHFLRRILNYIKQ